MKFSLLKKSFAAMAGCLLLGAGQAQAITINIASAVNASIDFDAATDSFSFTDGNGGFDFDITNVFDGPGTSIGFDGNLSGIFFIGGITTNGSEQSAPVTGTGTFSIEGGLFDLVATVDWIDIQTDGTLGGTNTGGNLNLTNIIYLGSDPDLVALAAAGSAIATISFTFIPGQSLSDLKTAGGDQSTSYSGTIATISTPDGGSILAMFGAGLIGLGILRRKLKA